MDKIYNVDKLNLLNCQDVNECNYFVKKPASMICAFLSDLIIEKKITLKLRDDEKIIIEALNYEPLKDPFLDEIFYEIRDSPKIHTLNYWINRFRGSIKFLNKSHLESMENKGLIRKNHPRKIFFRGLLCTLLFPIFLIGLLYFVLLLTTPNYYIKDSKIKESIMFEIINGIKPTSEVNQETIALIGIMNATKSSIFPNTVVEFDRLTRRYYYWHDLDFNNPELKLLFDHFAKMKGDYHSDLFFAEPIVPNLDIDSMEESK